MISIGTNGFINHKDLETVLIIGYQISRFTTEYFEKFVDWLANGFSYLEDQKFIYQDSFPKITIVEGYMVPRTLARTFVLLLRKYGDISSNSKSTQEMKSIIYCFFLQVLNSMSTTKVRGYH